MREAIGSSWLYYLVVVFLLIYVFFMSFIMNYASTYRAANYVVTQIETCQAQNNNCNGKTVDEIQSEIWTKYRYATPKGREMDICCVDNGAGGSVYRVKLPVAFDVPLLGTINWIKVMAETKTLQRVSCSNSSFNKC